MSPQELQVINFFKFYFKKYFLKKGSADLFAPNWDTGLPGVIAAGRKPSFGFNSICPLFKPFVQSVEEEAKLTKGTH